MLMRGRSFATLRTLAPFFHSSFGFFLQNPSCRYFSSDPVSESRTSPSPLSNAESEPEATERHVASVATSLPLLLNAHLFSFLQW